MQRLLDKDPMKRMDVHQAVMHPWIIAQGLAPLRTPSPLVMATRVQLAMAAGNGAAAAAAAAAAESVLSTGQQQLWRQQPTMQYDAGVKCLSGASSSIMRRQIPGMAAEASGTAPTLPALLSCSSSSANLMLLTGVDAAAAAADLLLDTVRGGRMQQAAVAMAARDVSMKPWMATTTAAAAVPSLPPPEAADAPVEGPWRMSAPATAQSASSATVSPAQSLTGMTATSFPSYLAPAFPSYLAPAFPGWVMPRIKEGGSTGSLGAMLPPTAAVLATSSVSTAGGCDISGGQRRTSSEVLELRRSVTDEELQAAISSCCDPAGSAAVLMERIFSEVTFTAK